jgi:hypothetical protein
MAAGCLRFGLSISKQLGSRKFLWHAAWAALLLAGTLVRPNSLLATNEVIPESGPDPSYREIVAKHLKSTFKDYSPYDAFEISDPRWVHSFKGWNWLICVRFEDHGHKRIYTLFLDGDNIVDARYAVQTDQCGTQAYGPFEQMLEGGLPPLH